MLTLLATTAKPFCGDGVADTALGEACDGVDLAGQDCTTLGQGWAGGTLGCAADCTFDTAACTPPPSCGDGVVGAGEDCDVGPPVDLGGEIGRAHV